MLFWLFGCSAGWKDTAHLLPFDRLATQYDIYAFGPPACGGDRQEGMFVAVGPDYFASGMACGQALSIRHEAGPAIVVVVNNLCPECDDKGSIDLQSQGAWPAFKATISDFYAGYEGDIPVTVVPQ
jgi:hypothetical protein